MDFYASRERGPDELLPWSHIDIGVSEAFFKDELARAMQAAVTPNCREKCSACGAARYKAGVCAGGQKKEEIKWLDNAADMK